MAHKRLWPEDDMIFDSPKDVVLVLHLATLAGGHNPSINLAARPTPTRTSHAFLRCVEPKKPHRTGCQATLLYLEYLKKGNPNGICKIHLPPRQKEATKLCDHHSQPDSGHSDSFGPMEPASSGLHLKVSSSKIYDKKGVALIEAGLKSSGRRRGYAIQSRHTKDVLVKCLGEAPGGGGPCKWQVRLVPAPGDKGHTISEIDPVHQCQPQLVLPGENLKRVLDFFPDVTLEAGLIGKSKRQQVRKKPKTADGAPPKPRVRKSAATAAPDYSGFSDEEDGVMDDHALATRVQNLIGICPPSIDNVEVPKFPSFEHIVLAMKDHLAAQASLDAPTPGQSSDAPSPAQTSDAGGTDASTTRSRPIGGGGKSKKSKYDIPEDDLGRQARRNAAAASGATASSTSKSKKKRDANASNGDEPRAIRDKSSSLSPLPLPEDDDGDSYHSDSNSVSASEESTGPGSAVDDDDDDEMIKPKRKRSKTNHREREHRDRDRDTPSSTSRAGSSRGAAQAAKTKMSRSASAQALALKQDSEADYAAEAASPGLDATPKAPASAPAPAYEPYRVSSMPVVSNNNNKIDPLAEAKEESIANRIGSTVPAVQDAAGFAQPSVVKPEPVDGGASMAMAVDGDEEKPKPQVGAVDSSSLPV